jgi:hypothetical protein
MEAQMKLLARIVSVLLGLWALSVLGAAAVAARMKRTRSDVGDEGSDEFELSTIMDSEQFASRANALRSGAWFTYFGGGELDLSRARIDPHGASLQLRAIFGGGEVTVPAECRVELHSQGFMGGVQNSTGDAPPDAPTLVIDAFCVVGGFDVRRGAAQSMRQPSAAAAPGV